ncbi:hypothetical protein GQ457_06G003790 [Hibiscus cannabinus]
MEKRVQKVKWKTKGNDFREESNVRKRVKSFLIVQVGTGYCRQRKWDILFRFKDWHEAVRQALPAYTASELGIAAAAVMMDTMLMFMRMDEFDEMFSRSIDHR